MFRLLRLQTTKHREKLYFCNVCLHYTHSEELMDMHKNECSRIVSYMPNEEESILKFDNHQRQMDVPFAVYADFECVLENKGMIDNNITQHNPCGYSYNIKCSFNECFDQFKIFTASDQNVNVGQHFVESLIVDCRRIYSQFLENEVQILPLTPLEQQQFNSAVTCHICGKGLDNEIPVRDHCHVSGKYRGPAHNACNLKYQIPKFIPIYFHNFSSYDCHLFIKDLLKVKGVSNIIPLNKELYISLSYTIDVYPEEEESNNKIELRFLDTLRFMAASLDSLASYLSDDDLYCVRKHFSNPNEFDLVKRKGVFPYEYVNSFQRLKETQLPPIEEFYSQLYKKECTVEDYNHAQKVWDIFSCRTLEEYMELYLKTDVLLLTDVFENFRKICKKIYNLDPCHYYTAPGLSWDAMLKTTKIELKLLTDIHKYNFIKKGIRGGITHCPKRYTKANNQHMRNFDSTKPSEYLMYFDANNLYGWAMSEYLPYDDFKWIDNIHQIPQVNNIAENSPIGYIFEVDLEYPSSIHNYHNDLPFCAENKIIGSTKYKKLITDLYNKTNYVIHYRVLQQCLANGLILKKVHRVLSFKQSPWLKNYIDLNTFHRKLAKNDFEKNFFKLLNNAIYGKTMENIDNRKDVKLITNWETTNKKHLGAEAWIAKPNFHSISKFNDNLWAVQMNRSKSKYNKPIYIGFCVLDLSKFKMYNFHYGYMKSKFKNNVSLNYMDTDSFIYSIRTNNFYEDIKSDIESNFDTSDYSENNIFNFPRVNKKILGMMKDENIGNIMTEFVGLGPKVYSFTTDNDKDIKKAKGVKKCVIDQYTIDNYKNCLFNREILSDFMYTFTSKLHNILTRKIHKVTLSPTDTKRKIKDDGINTYAWGHFEIEDSANTNLELDLLIREIELLNECTFS